VIHQTTKVCQKCNFYRNIPIIPLSLKNLKKKKKTKLFKKNDKCKINLYILHKLQISH
jgi:hypothetical protein